MIRSSSARALLGTVLGSGPGFLLPFVLTAHFGLGRLTDAYFYAFALAGLLGGLATVVIETNVLPATVVVGTRSPHAVGRYIRRTALEASGLCLGACVVLLAIGALAVSHQGGWTQSQRHLALALLSIFGVYVVVLAASSAVAAGCYAGGRFLAPTLTQSLRSLLPLALLPLVDHSSGALILVAAGVALGEMARLATLASLLRRSASVHGSIETSTLGDPPPSVWRAALPHALSMLVVGLNPIIDRTIAAGEGVGAVSKIDLGEKVLYAPLLALTSSLILVAGGRWAALVANGDPDLGRDVPRTARRCLLVAAVMTALLVGSFAVLAHVGPDTFGGVPTRDVVSVIVLLLAGLPSAVAINLGSRFVTVLRYTKVLPLFAAMSLTLNTTADLIGVALFGVEGIALASTVARTASAVLYFIVCRRLLRTTVDSFQRARSVT